MKHINFKGPNFSISGPPINRTEIDRTVNLTDVYFLIMMGELKVQTIQYRNEGGDKGKLFPYALFSGTFEKRTDTGLITHSGLIALDVDNVKNVEDVFQEIIADKYTALCYRTPSGRGLRIVYEVDINSASHEEYYNWISQYFKDKYSITVDAGCKNVSRAFYLNHDDKPYFQPMSDTFSSGCFQGYNANTTLEKIEYCVKEIVRRGLDVTHSYKEWLRVGFALAEELGEEGREYFHQVSCIHPEYERSGCDAQYDKCLDSNGKGITIASFFHQCSEAGINIKNSHTVKDVPMSTSTVVTAERRLEVASKLPPLRMLFDEFWYTNQVSILFGGTGLGKSILGVQLADAISKGNGVWELKNENPKLNVLYYDFELSDKQFEKRYSNRLTKKRYNFSSRLMFGNLSYDQYLDAIDSGEKVSFEDWLFKQIEKDITAHKIKVVIIDNITFLQSQSTQEGQVALELMKMLKGVKQKHDISMLIMAHTPKIKAGQPITINHMSGSSNLANLADSVFAIAKSKLDVTYRYLKQLKSRDGELKYNDENTPLIEILMRDAFLHFRYINFNSENDNLEEQMPKEDIMVEAKRLKNEGLSLRQIGEKLNRSHMTIKRYLHE